MKDLNPLDNDYKSRNGWHRKPSHLLNKKLDGPPALVFAQGNNTRSNNWIDDSNNIVSQS